MYSIIMSLGLVQLLEIIIGKAENALPSDALPSGSSDGSEGDLFGGLVGNVEYFPNLNDADIAIAVGLHTETGIDFSVLAPEILDFFELSADAFSAIIYAWMSELPITEQIVRFGKKVLASQNTLAIEPRRKAAELAATDRGDPDAQAVREAAYKVWHETNRLMGLLRFCPDEKGVYIAQCEPDHFVLPALGPHFLGRFGETPWSIIDNKRRLSLGCEAVQPGASGGTLVFSASAEKASSFEKGQGGEWENLWKHYHKTINNESRNNPDLQKRFMPTRYWKYLSEL
jgi:probable DNA metabolism protein